MYYGNQAVSVHLRAVRRRGLVGAPPSSIGKFGGDTDNWMWPRHTGDFSLFRIYAGKDNKPAAYSPENVPYRPKRHFTISTAGVEEGEFHDDLRPSRRQYARVLLLRTDASSTTPPRTPPTRPTDDRPPTTGRPADRPYDYYLRPPTTDGRTGRTAGRFRTVRTGNLPLTRNPYPNRLNPVPVNPDR